jgi:hypothetical protein
MSAIAIDTNLIINRAKAIAAMGLVERDYDGFNVVSPGLKKETYRIWRDEENHVRCNCPEFEDMIEREPRFRCEHIIAVKFHLNPPGEEQTSDQEQEIITEEFVPETVTINREVESEISSSFAGILDSLSRAITPDKIKHRVAWKDRAGRDREVDYVEWHTVADLLDQIYPEWSHQVNNIQQIGDMVAITASITIHGVTRQGVGTGSVYDEKGIKKAEHDALKRAAVKFGIARDLYRREDEMNIVNDGDEVGTGQKSFPSEPVAKTMADLVTPKQLVAIRAIAHAQRVNSEVECVKLMGCRPEELTRRAASAFIDHLKSLPAESPEIRQAG